MQTLIIVMLLVFGSSAAQASTTEIRARIAAVRIIVVDEHDRITQIYQNSDQEVTPDVRLIASSGKHLGYSANIAKQYQQIERSLIKGSVGKVYDQPKLPSLIETLYAML